ncbi:aspartate carbamoyltransferase catalytic subunit [Paenisporosarcina cavernae]|uniref:Aspartate carbamoyltransferase n=1 Tax=Paenisporosarcina cavernae TaxID=2320858 RepID=A0A385YS22_9BACL|nr:aspartate carbamoyltransferase catalytic subunit [Paenisporosarcina cavernae]AYC29180.1 aspartate carbamoyltransferase catalytic subunit [Paenisporosarcina cavernae]
MNHLVTMKDLSNENIMQLIKQAASFKHTEQHQKEYPHFVSNLFFEDSTRTKVSFEVAERKLGMHVIPFDASTSSVNKGETLLDTVKTLEAIGVEVVVIRSSEENYYEELLANTKMKIINAGDGSGQHPSQSLLDLFTIYEEFGTFKELSVVIAGDIAHSRVARSNAQALSKLGANVQYVAPPEWSGEFDCLPNWDSVLSTADVVMLLRVQHERHQPDQSFGTDTYHDLYGLTVERYNELKDTAIIMHPAPVNRGVEIASELVESDKSRIFKQMENGVYMRMAMLEFILGGDQE